MIICKVCDSYGNVTAWSKDVDTGFSGFTFKCSCPKGASNIKSYPVWGHKFSKDFTIDPNYWSRKPQELQENDILRIRQLIKDKQFESEEFKNYLLKYGREKVEDIYRNPKS